MEKIALVTGASRGIGRAIATELSRRGWAVAIGYRVRRDKAEELARQLTDRGCRAMICQADVSRREQVEAMVHRVEQTLGPISLLVNNAGIAGQCLFQELTDARWHEFFAVNVDGAFYTSRAVLPSMRHEHEGCIVNVSSIWGLWAAWGLRRILRRQWPFLPIRRQISSPARCSPATEGSSSNYWRKICGFSAKRLAVWCVRNFAAQRQNTTPAAGVVFSLTHMAR